MEQAVLFRLAADAVLLLHALFVVFVIAGLVLVLAGRPLGWQWIYHFGFRMTHLCAIAVVVLLSWLGAACPLTGWEMKLRAQAGDATYTGAFIAHWVEELLYYRAPDWVFAALYTAFGALVVASWFWVRPRH